MIATDSRIAADPTSPAERPETPLPRREILDRVARRIAQRRPDKGAGFLASVRDVLVVASSSRSGSSCFVEMLKRSPRLLHFPGEINPFLRLCGLAWPDTAADSDAVHPGEMGAAAVAQLERYFAAEAGAPRRDPRFLPTVELVDDLYVRLHLQWPLDEFTLAEVREATETAARNLASLDAAHTGGAPEVQRFHALFLAGIRRRHPAVNPYYYDIGRTLLRQIFPQAAAPAGAPSPVIVEEPPFILTRPWDRPAHPGDAVLVLKTPSDAYRLGWLRWLFRAARFRLVHLTRNPAASINGIRDGWRHHGFHSNFVGEELRVPGYGAPGSAERGWWKFDLPPDWRRHAGDTLEEICAFQWRSAHQSILEFRRATGVECRQVRFEDLLGGDGPRRRALGELFDWIGVSSGSRDGEAEPRLPAVMATGAPRPGRWRENAAAIEAVCRDRAIREVCGRLGYEDPATWV